EERRGVARRLDDLRVLAGQLQQPASRPLPQTAAPRTRDPQADRRHEPQGTHHRAARVVFQGRHRQGGDRARQGEEAARQARGPEASSRGAGAGPSHADAALLTRTSDTLIDLADRGASCRAECDLFVSIHVNAMPAGRSVERTSGVETYFLSDAKTEDQERVAKMENDALRFESTPTG